MAASLAFSSQIELDEVLRKCLWKSHTTFSEFYLKDMTQVRDDLLSLGPLVAAQKVVIVIEAGNFLLYRFAPQI